ncbi:D-amino acid dehydrogenase [Neisseria sp.]|uniref:D-amino acid dehydrogenase n=1 Tax=Neisseria sp. TaxID=192066 RepID=UPI0035A09048
MKTVVMGAGIAGVCTAWYLLEAGHEVTLLEKEGGVAEATSFANAGQISYGYTTPWAAPGMPAKAGKWLFKAHSPLILRPDGSTFQLQWLWQMLKNCTAERYHLNKERMVRISEYSREMFRRFEAQHGLDFEGRKLGTLQIFRTAKEAEAAEKDIDVLAHYGVPYQRLNPQECLQYEPGLAHALDKITAALRLPNDATGDCRMFAVKLAEMCRLKGADFRFGCEIGKIERQGRRITAVEAGGERFEADAFVCALGCFSRTVLAQLSLNLPVYPVKGYSLTMPVADEAAAPVSTVIDETYKVAVTRFERRIRVGGMAELSGYRLALPQQHKETLLMVADGLFKGGGDTAQTEYWSGMRPMTPDSTPVIGATPFDNLFTNTGHGTLGWTMSLGSAKLTADLVCGVRPEIRCDDLGLARYA